MKEKWEELTEDERRGLRHNFDYLLSRLMVNFQVDPQKSIGWDGSKELLAIYDCKSESDVKKFIGGYFNNDLIDENLDQCISMKAEDGNVDVKVELYEVPKSWQDEYLTEIRHCLCAAWIEWWADNTLWGLEHSLERYRSGNEARAKEVMKERQQLEEAGEE